jgi:cytochrome b
MGRKETPIKAATPPSRIVSSVAPEAIRWVKVWDVPTRVFHWVLVSLVGVNALTGFFAPEWWLGVHKWGGYALVALMMFRLVWGICGSEYSRIVSFAYPPRATIEHVRGLLLLRPPHYVGHNPTGALMVFALAAVLFALVVSGLLALGGEEKQGPLAGVVGFSVGSAAEQVHHWLTVLLFAMATIHIAGVVLESVLTRDNLARAMITGWKKLPLATPAPEHRAARPILAVVLFALLGGAAVGTLDWFSRRPTPPSLRALSENATYEKECGACHYAFHPSLLPASSWTGLMTSLREHFGEDATLDGPTASLLTAWLVGNSSETFDTEPANRFRIVSPNDPYRVSSTPYWIRKHAGISPDVFVSKSVRGKANCHACHQDAKSGRYDDQAIAIPKEVRR